MVFRFRRFAVRHGRSSMRVGTDAVLIGVWADVAGCRRVLDVGTGCGVVALMLAQRAPAAQVTGIDVDAPSVEEAAANFAASPWAGRLRAERADVRVYAECLRAEGRESSVETALANGAGKAAAVSDDKEEWKYDCIVSNPPYFTETTLPPQSSRAVARHAVAAGLTVGGLLDAVVGLLRRGGRVALVLPAEQEKMATEEATARGLLLRRVLAVRTVARRPARRVLMEWQYGGTTTVQREELLLTDPATGGRSAAYAALTATFYL